MPEFKLRIYAELEVVEGITCPLPPDFVYVEAEPWHVFDIPSEYFVGEEPPEKVSDIEKTYWFDLTENKVKFSKKKRRPHGMKGYDWHWVPSDMFRFVIDPKTKHPVGVMVEKGTDWRGIFDVEQTDITAATIEKALEHPSIAPYIKYDGKKHTKKVDYRSFLKKLPE